MRLSRWAIKILTSGTVEKHNRRKPGDTDRLRFGLRRSDPVLLLAVLALAGGFFLIPSAGAQDQTNYRVVNVASDDTLNVRTAAGESNEIVGTLAHDAVGVRWTGREMIAPDGGRWYEIEHADLSGPGWVDSSLLDAAETQSAAPASSGPEGSPVDRASAYTGQDGYAEIDAREFASSIYDHLPPDPSSVLMPDSDIGPLTKSLLLVEANDGVLPRSRYRIRYGVDQLPPAGAGGPVTLSLIQIDRFNMGPAMREELAATGAPVGPEEAFGIGPHVSYRIVMRPIQGQTADPIAVSRAEIATEAASDMRCLSMPCLNTVPIGETFSNWQDMRDLPVRLDVSYETVRNGVLSPAAALDLALVEMHVQSKDNGRLRWRGSEPGDGGSSDDPAMEAVIDVNLGQDDGIDAVLHSHARLEDTPGATWGRVVSFRGPAGPVAATQHAGE